MCSRITLNELAPSFDRELGEAGIRVSRFSSLYESAPAYVTDQVRLEAGWRRAAALLS